MNKSLRMLAHPPALLAIAVLALNDFVLKPLVPSWLTGKLSDVAVLFFLPLLLSGVIGLALPRRWRAGEGLALGLGYGLTLVGFVLLKASPSSAGWLAETVHEATGFRLRALADPSDLLTLPFLALSAWWRVSGPLASRPAFGWRVLAVPLAAMLLLADAAMPDQGVDCLQQSEGTMLARGGYYRVFASRDGGLTWLEQTDAQWAGNCGLLAESDESLASLPDGNLTYRIRRGGAVERSMDDAQTWQAVAGLAPVGEVEEAYIRKMRGSNLMFDVPPLDALLDPASGNLVLAMGQQGVLVVRPDGTSQWASVAFYRRESLRGAGAQGYFTLLTGELVLAGLAGLICTGTLALARRRRAWLVVSVLAWLTLFVTGLALHPSVANASYVGIIPVAGLLVTGIWALVFTVGAAAALKSGLLARLPVALLGALLLFLPYVLWGMGVLPSYWMAQALAGILALGAILTGALSGRGVELAR